MSELLSPEELLKQYPESLPEEPNAGYPFPSLAAEAAALLALGQKPDVAARCEACGLRKGAWKALGKAHQGFVSAQAHWGAARTYGLADAALTDKAARLVFLRDELLAQAEFYLTDSDDQKRLAAIREGDNLADTIQDARQLPQVIRPKADLILDPEFELESLDEALRLADEVEKALAGRSADAAAERRGQELRRLRDRTVYQLLDLMREIRRYGKYAFRNDPKLREAFQSEYLRRHRRKGAAKPAQPEPPAS